MASKNYSRLFRRFLHELGNNGDEAAIEKFLSARFVEHQPTPPSAPTGRDAVRELFSSMRQGLPDLTIRFDDVFQAGDRVVARTTWTGTHRGELFGIPPTGRKVSFQSIDIVRYEGKLAMEHWGLTDRGSIVMQLGTPVPRNVYVKAETKAKRAGRVGRARPRTSRAASMTPSVGRRSR